MHFRSLSLIGLCSLSSGLAAELAPAPSLPEVKLPKGSDAVVLADQANQSVTSPTAFTVNEQGEWFVTETHRFMRGQGIDDNRQRRYWILDDIASQTTDDRLKMYQKWYAKHPPEYYTKNSEKIRRIVDTDGDHQADKTNLYADGFNDPLDGTAAGIFSFNGTTYFACIPHIWAMKDTDNDGTYDKKTSLQDGFGVRVSFSGHDLNGFAIGPDGRLYATIGDRGFNITTKEGKNYAYPGQGAILRFDLDGSNMEAVHVGLRNPKEIAFDQYGHGITVDNNSDQGDRARIVYVVDGADSGWRMGHQVMHSFHRTAGLKEHPINRWMAEKMWAPRNAEQPAWLLPPLQNYTAGPSGLTYQPGTGYMGMGADKFFICDYRGGRSNSRVSTFKVTAAGAGLEVSENADFAVGTAATDVEFGYDGRLYISDFMGGWATHKNGRIFSVSEGAPDAKTIEVTELVKNGVHTLPTERLTQLLGHADQRVRLRAQLALSEKPEALEQFTQAATQGKDLMSRLHGTWGLWLIGRRDQNKGAAKVLESLLTDKDLEIRAQAARAYGEVAGAKGDALLPLIKSGSARVKFFAAQSLARVPITTAANALLKAIETNNNEDLHLRHALTNALSATLDEKALAKLKKDPRSSVRLAAVIALRGKKSPLLNEFLRDEDSSIVAEAIRSIHDQQLIDQQDEIANLIDSYLKLDELKLSEMIQRRLIHSAFRSGGPQNAARLVKIAASDNWISAQRVEALRLLSLWSNPFPVDQSTGKFAPLPQREIAKVKPALAKNLASLLANDGRLLEMTLNLVDQYDLEIEGLNDERLLSFVNNVKLQPNVRAQSLKSLAKRKTGDLPALLDKFSRDPADAVAIAAMQLLANEDPDKATALAVSITNNMKVNAVRRQAAWTVLGSLEQAPAKERLVEGLEQLTSGKEADPSSSLELVEAAEASKADEIKKALLNYQNQAAQADSLGTWKVALLGGNADNGRQLFESHGSAQCMRCHSVGYGHEAGGNAGPNLAGIAVRGDRSYLLESLIHPSEDVVSGYGTVTLFFENGGFLSGLMVGEDEQTISVQEGTEVWKVKKSEIAKQSGPNSAMPSMSDILTRSEARDIVAYLATLKKDNREAPKPSDAKPFDISKAKQDPKMLGGIVFQNVCASCHGESGEGLSPNPPLDGSQWLSLDDRNLIRMQLHGLSGPISVKGRTYELAMPSNANLSDQELAAVLSFARSKWAKSDKAIDPELVAKLRSETRSTPWTAAELLEQTSPRIRGIIERGGVPQSNTLPNPMDSYEASGEGGVHKHAVMTLGLFLVLTLAGLFIPTKGQ